MRPAPNFLGSVNCVHFLERPGWVSCVYLGPEPWLPGSSGIMRHGYSRIRHASIKRRLGTPVDACYTRYFDAANIYRGSWVWHRVKGKSPTGIVQDESKGESIGQDIDHGSLAACFL